MTTVYDVPADLLIKRLADKLKNEEKVKPPEWAEYVKTGIHREKAPSQKEWWYIRVAAVLRKIYMRGPIGVSRLSAQFGGRVDRGSKPYHAGKGSRSITREAIKQLESIGYISVEKGVGRNISPKGQSFLDNTSYEVFKEIAKDNIELAKY